MVEAGERLDAEDAGRRHRDDRLEVHVDRVVVERDPQRELELAAAPGLHAQVVVEDLDLRAAHLLRPPHGDVRVAQQLFGVTVATGRERDADAGVQRGLAAVGEEDRFGDQALDLGRALRDRFDAGHVAAHHDELVAGDAADAVHGAGRALEALADLGQHLVAARVTHRVVHELEAVDVDEQHGRVRLRAAAARERVLQAVDEHGAVAESGQLVVRGAVAQLLLGVDHVGDVGERGHRAGRRARRGGERPAAEREPAFRVVDDEPDEHVVHRLVVGEGTRDGVVGEFQRAPVGADEAVGSHEAVEQPGAGFDRQRENAVRRRVRVDDQARGVGDDDALVDGFDDGAVQLFDHAALLFGAAGARSCRHTRRPSRSGRRRRRRSRSPTRGR